MFIDQEGLVHIDERQQPGWIGPIAANVHHDLEQIMILFLPPNNQDTHLQIVLNRHYETVAVLD